MKPVRIHSTSSNATQIITGVLVVGAATAAWFLIAKPALEWAGIKKTKYDRKLPKFKGFDPNYYKDHLRQVTISTAKASRLANDIYASYGFAIEHDPSKEASFFDKWKATTSAITKFGNDDEVRLITAVREAGSEVNLSKVSDVFQKNYGEPMNEYIMSFADNADTEAMFKLIKNFNN
jgi:hypothetical protein